VQDKNQSCSDVYYYRLPPSPSFKRLFEFTAMSIPLDALHTLRASPVVGVGGVYATWNGIGDIVTVAAEVPGTVEHQLVGTVYLNDSIR
jgi:hypothetical protein